MNRSADNLTPVRRIRKACLIEKAGTGIRGDCTDLGCGSGFSRDSEAGRSFVAAETAPTIEKSGTGIAREVVA